MGIRLILFIVLGYLVLRLVKGWVKGKRLTGRMDGRSAPRIDDVMVQDPQCGTYFARRDGVSLKDGQRELLFCSRQCRDQYLQDHAQKGN